MALILKRPRWSAVSKVRFLLSKGARTDFRDTIKGKTALEHAHSQDVKDLLFKVRLGSSIPDASEDSPT